MTTPADTYQYQETTKEVSQEVLDNVNQFEKTTNDKSRWDKEENFRQCLLMYLYREMVYNDMEDDNEDTESLMEKILDAANSGQ